ATQRIFRVAVVVERNRFPVARAVTAFAFLAELALVLVVGLVTSDARARRLAVARVLVAVATLHVGVFSRELEARLAVIELPDLLPLVLRVTVAALRSERALVHVVLAVACIAVRRRFAPLLAGLMALRAVDLHVPAA